MSKPSPTYGNTARVIATYGKFSLLETSEKEHIQCTKRSGVEPVVIGDYVEYIDSVVIKIQKRTSLLCNNSKNIAANITRVFIIVAVEPHPSLMSIDSYIIKCHSIGITPIIVLNKIDLAPAHKVNELLGIYRDIGYEVLSVSTITTIGVSSLQEAIAHHQCVFVGHSGVGKSSLITAVSGTKVRVDQLGNDGLGKHTTTNSSLFDTCQGSIIDTPGVREFTALDMSSDEIISGFIEFKEYLGECKFGNCKHINEPKCRIKECVEAGAIHRHRYNNYSTLISPYL